MLLLKVVTILPSRFTKIQSGGGNAFVPVIAGEKSDDVPDTSKGIFHLAGVIYRPLIEAVVDETKVARLGPVET